MIWFACSVYFLKKNIKKLFIVVYCWYWFLIVCCFLLFDTFDFDFLNFLFLIFFFLFFWFLIFLFLIFFLFWFRLFVGFILFAFDLMNFILSISIYILQFSLIHLKWMDFLLCATANFRFLCQWHRESQMLVLVRHQSMDANLCTSIGFHKVSVDSPSK